MPCLRRAVAALVFAAAATLPSAGCPEVTEGFTCTEYDQPPRHASTPPGRYVMYFYIETCPHCQDARPKVDAWRSTLPPEVRPITFRLRRSDRPLSIIQRTSSRRAGALSTFFAAPHG